MPKVYGYARVSTRGQDYDTQVEMIRDYCKMKGFELIAIFADKASGKDVERAEYQRMMDTLKENPQEIDTIVVSKLDRIGRSLRDLLRFVDWVKENKINFVSIGNSIDTTTSEGRLILYIFGGLSEYEREIILDRTETGRKRFLEDGGHLGKKPMNLPLAEINRLLKEGVPKAKVAKMFRICRQTLYDRLKQQDEQNKKETVVEKS